MQPESNKTRNLSIFEFLEVLQKEYICCELRVKTYTHEKQRLYWQEVGEKKKEKILSISQKYTLPTIFSDPSIHKIMEFSIYGNFGFPHFIYRDETQKVQIQKWDVLNYYSKDTPVKVDINGEIKDGKVLKTEIFDPPPIILVQVGQEALFLKGEQVTRIF